MKKINKKVKWTLAATFTIAIVFCIFGIILHSLLPPSKEKMEKYYYCDKEDLNLIADYLDGLNYSFVSIDKSDIKEGVMFTGAYSRYQEIDDKQALKALKRLLKTGKYETIGKYYNTVFFQKWSFLEKDRGIAVNVYENETIFIEYLVDSEPLNDHNWYYYEVDYAK